MIWLDVTTLLGWRRPPVGIIRTELELARYAVSTIPDQVRFCRFTSSGYGEVGAEQVAIKIGEILTRRQGDPVAADADLIALSRGARLGAQLKAAIGFLPAPVSRAVLARIDRNRNGIERIVLSLRHILHCIRELRGTNPHQLALKATPSQSCFALGDVYLSAGLDWENRANAFLYAQRQALGLTIVRTCYDVIPVKYPHLSAPIEVGVTSGYFLGLARVASHVLCISERSRDDLVAFLKQNGTAVPPSSLIRLGDTLVGQGAEKLPVEISGEFILYVSTIERRKNHEAIARAIGHLVDAGHGAILPKVVFVGMPGWGVQDLLTEIDLDPRLKGRVIVLNNVTDPELISLYQRCLFTVFPSFYEGWGLGVAESLSMGKFSIVSNAGSLPEIGGDLVEYLDPIDGLGWAHRILHYITDRDALRHREERIKKEYAPTRWETTAQQAFAVTKSLNA